MQDHFKYLDELKSHIICLGLESISQLLERLRNPHKSYGSVLVAGTNGKGSIASMVASILEQGGWRIGLYTSPHLVDVRERIKVNGRMITREQMGACIEDIQSNVRENVTYFEFLTAVAFLHFYRMRVDLAVLEVGMGGRLDATNVVTPLVSVVSNIALDHREYLGNSLELIAREKGGIIKSEGICVTAVRQKKVIHILEDICLEKRGKLVRLGKDMAVRPNRNGTFNYMGLRKTYRAISCPLRGRHQFDNAALAICAVESIKEAGFEVEDEAIYQGIRNTKWEGRLELLQHKPMILVDGAHNPAGISSLCRALKSEFVYKRLIVIFGVLQDKDYRNMLKKILPMTYRMIITQPQVERAMSPESIVPAAFHHNYRNIEMIDHSTDALKQALEWADMDDLICITGSLYLVGEVKRAFKS